MIRITNWRRAKQILYGIGALASFVALAGYALAQDSTPKAAAEGITIDTTTVIPLGLVIVFAGLIWKMATYSAAINEHCRNANMHVTPEQKNQWLTVDRHAEMCGRVGKQLETATQLAADLGRMIEELPEKLKNA